jgi:hypothetical protein
MTWREASFTIWGVLAAMLVGCQVMALVSRGRLPTMGALFRVITTGPLRRSVVLLGWMWLGWHAFAR